MRKLVKMIIILGAIIIQFGQLNYVYADDIFSPAESFLEKGKEQKQNSDIKDSRIKKASNTMFNTLLAIGTVLTVIIGGILGIKFMMSSAEDKAQVKEMMIPYIAGCVIIYGAFAIWKLVVTIGNQL